jgi:mannosyl-3-phosphoglycerate phosphatase family protein
MPAKKRIIVFTDLDGTLLDYSTRSFSDALPALHLIVQKDIPLVICSSKTAAEIEHYRRWLRNSDPFISENGGGIFVPKGYFGFSVADWWCGQPHQSGSFDADGKYEGVRLGAKYEDLRSFMSILRERFPIRGFGDMSVEEISELTGLPLKEALMARMREFDEPFVIEEDQTKASDVAEAIEKAGFRSTLGRFCHLMGNSDKGKAVSLVTSMYEEGLNSVTTVAIGDAPNDIPMLRAVDYPVVVQQPDGSYKGALEMPRLIMADGKGPTGWNRAMIELLNRLT